MDGWRNATRVCLVGLGIALAILFTTGVWLWFRYVPTESWVRVTHRVASFVAVTLGVVTVVLLIGRRVRTGDRGIVAGIAVAFTAVAAAFTGYLLPWDQLALGAVTVGGNRRGVSTVFDTDVKYLLIGSREVTVDTYRFWAVSHLLLGVLVAGAVVLAWLRTRANPVAPTTDPPELVPVGQE